MKKILKLLLLFLSLCLAGLMFYIHLTKIAPRSIQVRQEMIRSDEIPAEMNDIRIVFFSDVHYNGFVNEERFQIVVEAINNQRPDIVLFGGDLFDHPSNLVPSEEVQQQILAQLKEIEAPLGKFAVLGNHDLESETTQELVSQILTDGDFEIITNKTIRLRNRSGASIVLAGLDSELLGNPEIENTFASIQSTDFSIILCHTPDTILNCPLSQIDLFLAGHSHGGQIYFPFVGSLVKVPYAEVYYRGKHQLDNAILDITNGTGTTRMDLRFLAEAEIVVYTLRSTKIDESSSSALPITE